MGYTLQFGQIAGDVPYLLAGAWPTLIIAFASFFLGAAIGLAAALAITAGGAVARTAGRLWVGFFTNSPLFVILFYLFNGLPDVGVLLSPMQATLIAFVLVSSGYLAEIQRGGIQSVRQSELDAAEILGFSRMQKVRHVIVPHVMATVYPPMANFFIFLLLGTSMASSVGVDELTGRAIEIASRTFRSVEIFLVTAAAYAVLTVLASAALALVGRVLFRVRARVF